MEKSSEIEPDKKAEKMTVRRKKLRMLLLKSFQVSIINPKLKNHMLEEITNKS